MSLPPDLNNQIEYLKFKIDFEQSFSHLEMVHDVLPIIRNLVILLERQKRELDFTPDERAQIARYGHIL